ncbi:MAG: hypothetical protein FJY81_02220, partial [Candidatus Aminicenantes bacterium]|nr:hypothetical protein [Candidatus Aminicenantes bacterium]
RMAPPGHVEGENILDLLDKGKGLHFLVVHGDRDQAAPVEETRQAVEKMKALGMHFHYIEVKGRGHGDYEKWEDIFNWLRDVVRLQKR